MPITIDLMPLPRFDNSLIRYLGVNFGRIRDAITGQPRQQAGRVSITFTAQAGVAVTVTFAKAFTTTPIVTAVMEDGFAAGADVEITAISTTAVTLRGFSTDKGLFTGTMAIHWIASESTQ